MLVDLRKEKAYEPEFNGSENERSWDRRFESTGLTGSSNQNREQEHDRISKESGRDQQGV